MNYILKEIPKNPDTYWYESPEALLFYQKLLIVSEEFTVIGVPYKTRYITGISMSAINGWVYTYKEPCRDDRELILPCIEVVSFCFQDNRNERLINEFLSGKQ